MKTRAAFLTFFLFLAVPYFLAAQTASKARASHTPEYTFKMVHAFPHDPAAFIQGLAYRDGFLDEGTGLEGASSLRKVRLETGEVLKRVDLSPDLFGEGITFYKDEIIQLTWRSQTGFVYEASDFRLLRRFSYQSEGWGLATNGAPNNELFMSDGSSEIRVLDATTLNEKRRLHGPRGRQTDRSAQGARVCGRRNLRERLANRSHRAYLPANRQNSWLD